MPLCARFTARPSTSAPASSLARGAAPPLIGSLTGKLKSARELQTFQCRNQGGRQVLLDVNAKARFDASYWRGILDSQGKVDGGYYQIALRPFVWSASTSRMRSDRGVASVRARRGVSADRWVGARVLPGVAWASSPVVPREVSGP